MIPVIKAETERTEYPDGRVDVRIKVPLLEMAGASEDGFTYSKKILMEKFGLSEDEAEQKLKSALERERGN